MSTLKKMITTLEWKALLSPYTLSSILQLYLKTPCSILLIHEPTHRICLPDILHRIKIMQPTFTKIQELDVLHPTLHQTAHELLNTDTNWLVVINPSCKELCELIEQINDRNRDAKVYAPT